MNIRHVCSRLLLCICVTHLIYMGARGWVHAEELDDRLPVHVDGRLGFIDLSGNLLFLTEFSTYDDGRPEEPRWTEGFLWVRTNFIDRHGNRLSPKALGDFDFMYRPSFRQGYAHVSVQDADRELYGIIGTSGRIVFTSPRPFRDTDFADNLHPVPLAGGFGYIDTNGTVAVAGPFEAARDFQEGLAWVRQNGKWGAIDCTGRYTVRPDYADVHNSGFCCGHAWVRRAKRWGLIDTSGRTILKPQYDSVGSIRGELACVESKGRWGVVDSTGRYRIRPRYDKIEPLWGAESLWKIQYNGKHGLATSEGTVTLPVDYDEICGFIGTNAYTWIRKGDLGGIIDRSGTLVVQPIYDILHPSFEEGLAPFRLKGKCGYVNQHFRVVIEPRFGPNNFNEYFSCGRARIRDRNGKYGFIDSNGGFVIPARYDRAAWKFKYDLASVATGKYPESPQWGVINAHGEIVVPLEYDGAAVVRPGIVKLYKGSSYGYLRVPDTWIWALRE